MTNTNTYKAIGVALGTGLAILWIAGLSSPYAAGWFTWLVGVAALGAFLIAGRFRETEFGSQRNGPIALSVGLFALWIAGLATGAVAWLCWWTFAFACASLVFGVSAAGTQSLPEQEKPFEEMKETHDDQFKKTG